jgi:hypothetical protein
VGQVRQRTEPGPALEIHEEEVDPVRWMAEGQSQGEGPQQFGLARAGGPRDQQMRAVGYEVKAARSGSAHSQRYGQPVGLAARLPSGSDAFRRERQKVLE